MGKALWRTERSVRRDEFGTPCDFGDYLQFDSGSTDTLRGHWRVLLHRVYCFEVTKPSSCGPMAPALCLAVDDKKDADEHHRCSNESPD